MSGGRTFEHTTDWKLYRIICAVSVLLLLLCGCKSTNLNCESGDDYDDFVIHLARNYYIAESNSHSLHLCRENDGLLLFAIKYFYVRHYIVTDNYIYLEGICTERWERATNEELAENKLFYYSVSLQSDEVFGPFETYDEFVSFCNVDFENCDLQWIEPIFLRSAF